MSARSRPTTGWSTAMSTTTKLSNLSNQTAPLVTTRRKLFRNMINNQKNSSQRMKQSKYDIEELFNLYYSNDIKFDTLQKQIVTGTRISTSRTVPISHYNLANTSIDTFDSKHCVTREQLSNLNLNGNEQQPIINETNKDSMCHISPPITIPTAPNLPETSSSIEQNELCDSLLVKSATFLDDNFNNSHEHTDTSKQRPISPKSISSSSTAVREGVAPPPPPSLIMMTNNPNNKQRIISLQQNRTPVVTSSAIPFRQRSLTKTSEPKQRSKSSITFNSRQSSPKARPPSAYTHISIESDMPELPVPIGTQRTVSIPSKCSRYILVTFPETPLRYNTPTYVERLLLPDRFPTLFQNILHSYDSRLSNSSRHRKTK